MIQVSIFGGLGNQLFQYASAKNLARLNNTDLYLRLDWFNQDFEASNTTPRFFDLSNFKLNYKISGSYYDRIYNKLVHPFHYCEPDTFSYDPKFLRLRHNNIWLNGYWARNNYFDDIRDILIEEMQPKEINAPNQQTVSEIKQTNSVSIHLRRGDYLTNKSANSLFQILDIDYYHKAIEYIKARIDDPIFYIFSDDISYAVEHFVGSEFRIIDINSGRNSYMDLYLISQCKHNINANSTFSWWGSYLNNSTERIIIIPEKWYKDNNAIAQESNYDSSNNYSKNWITM